MTTPSNAIKGHLAALFTALIWGSTFVATKVLLRRFGPVEIIFLRFLLGWGALWLMRPRTLRVEGWKTEALFALAGLTGVTMNYMLETFALVYTQASNLAVIVATAPLFVGIIAVFILKQRLRGSFFLGFAISITGIYLLSFSEGNPMELHLFGDLLGLGVAFVWAIYSLVVERLGDRGFDVILTTRRVFFYGILFMLPLLGQGENFRHMERWLNPVDLTLLLSLGLVACAVSYITWNYAVGAIGSVRANLYIYVSPVVTIALSICFLNEAVTLRAVVGMALAIGGVFISEGVLQKRSRG